MQSPLLALGGAGLVYLGAQFFTISTALGSLLMVAALVCFGWAGVELAGIVLPHGDRRE